ncbi:hypothetical protein ON010_g3453 [Phytophthora cinnamomi]|nr:hypothetical protein ON010_g3453 [Phytophthora cinnamomi]
MTFGLSDPTPGVICKQKRLEVVNASAETLSVVRNCYQKFDLFLGYGIRVVNQQRRLCKLFDNMKPRYIEDDSSDVKETSLVFQGARPLQVTAAALRQQRSPELRAPAAPVTASPARVVGSALEAAAEPDQAAPSHLYQLLLRPIVKATIAQRDTSTETLDDIAINR